MDGFLTMINLGFLQSLPKGLLQGRFYAVIMASVVAHTTAYVIFTQFTWFSTISAQFSQQFVRCFPFYWICCSLLCTAEKCAATIFHQQTVGCHSQYLSDCILTNTSASLCGHDEFTVQSIRYAISLQLAEKYCVSKVPTTTRYV